MTSHLVHSLVGIGCLVVVVAVKNYFLGHTVIGALFTAVAAFDISCVERQLNLVQVIRKSLAPYYLSLKQVALKMNFMFFPKKWV